MPDTVFTTGPTVLTGPGDIVFHHTASSWHLKMLKFPFVKTFAERNNYGKLTVTLVVAAAVVVFLSLVLAAIM